jgi:hypothetical protein
MPDRPKRAEGTRFRGHRGGVISMHRALAKFALEPLDLVMSSLLVLLFSFLWIASLPWLCRLWQHVFMAVTGLLAPHIEVGLQEHHVTSYIRFVVPYPRMEDVGPDARTWWVVAMIVLVLFSASFLFSDRFTPAAYLLRAVLFVQGTALLYFAWSPGRFPHTPDSYMEGLVDYGIALISFVPILFGLTYYIFNFGLIRKALLTAMTMVHLSLFLPVQVLLQAIVLQKSILFMPLLYVVFGLSLDVLVIMAFYAWGMSWPSKKQGAL